MEQKEKFDAFMRMADFAHKHFHERRQYEWKITIGFWTLIVAAITLVVTGRATTLDTELLKYLSTVVVVAFIFLWIRGTYVANANDKEMRDSFWRDAENVLENPNHTSSGFYPEIPTWSRRWCSGFLCDWARIFQTVTTAILGAALWILAE